MPPRTPTADKRWKYITTTIAAVAGIVSILMFSGDVIRAVDDFVVSSDELSAMESRIIQKIEDEAVLTRTVYIQEMIERKTKLTEQLDDTVEAGKVAKLLEEIRELNARIEKLRGK